LTIPYKRITLQFQEGKLGVFLMSAGKIILLVLGIIGLLISIGLLVGGGALLWADNTIKDSEGFYTTRTIQIEKDSYAIVTGPANIDIDAGWGWGWGWDLGDLATFKVEGSNNDPSNQIFIGVARESDIDAYLSSVEYDEMTQLHIYPYSVDYRNHPGSIVPGAPTSQTFWTESTYGTGTQILEWELEPGSHSLVLMNNDGSAGVDMNIVFGAKVPLLIGVGVGILVAGAVGLLISILMIYFSVRRRVTVPPAPPETPVSTETVSSEPPETPASTENETEKPEVKPVVIGEVENKTNVGLNPNVASLLCYLLGWVTGIVFFILEKENKLVRFHALQSIIVFGALTIASTLLSRIPVIGGFFGAVIGILMFVLWIVLMIKAYQGEKYKIPWAGDFAEKQVS
jgi:uncharacterized membrane protein